MAEPHELRSYDYVNRAYTTVRDALKADAGGIFQRATSGAAGRASALAASLKVDLGGVQVGANVSIEVAGIEEGTRGSRDHTPVTRIKLRWKAARAAAIFPSMEAELSVYPLSPEETQLDLHGLYRPPFGALGAAVDTLALHRIAEASVHRFVADVAALLRGELPAD